MGEHLDAAWRRYDLSFHALLDLLPASLLPRCKRIFYAPNEVVVGEGDALSHIYFIESGVVEGMKRFENGKDYRYFKLDQVNGAIGLLELFSRQRTIIATVVAKTHVSILRVDAAELYAAVMEDAALLRKYTHHIAKDLYEDSGRNGQLFYQSGLERLRCYLADYYAKNAVGCDVVVVRQSYECIASRIGVSTRTVGRAVQCLRKSGLCTHEGKFIRLDRRQYEKLLEDVP